MDLRSLLGMTTQKPYFTEREKTSRRMIRQLSLMGYGAYEIWEITTEMERLTLSAQEHPDLFPPNQKPLKFIDNQNP